MKFIFPQNYNFKSKFLGFIDYNTIFLNFIWDLFIFIIIQIFNSVYIKILFFIIFSFPLLLFSITGFNGENIFYVFKYMLIFIFKTKMLFFLKK